MILGLLQFLDIRECTSKIGQLCHDLQGRPGMKINSSNFIKNKLATKMVAITVITFVPQLSNDVMSDIDGYCSMTLVHRLITAKHHEIVTSCLYC